jgi:hypothetical protein
VEGIGILIEAMLCLIPETFLTVRLFGLNKRLSLWLHGVYEAFKKAPCRHNLVPKLERHTTFN